MAPTPMLESCWFQFGSDLILPNLIITNVSELTSGHDLALRLDSDLVAKSALALPMAI